MQAIRTRYHGPGNRLGSRVSATAGAGRKVYEWDNALNPEQNHVKAAMMFAESFGWGTAWASGCLADGDWAHVNTEAP